MWLYESWNQNQVFIPLKKKKNHNTNATWYQVASR
jgi:hypothetical protein